MNEPQPTSVSHSLPEHALTVDLDRQRRCGFPEVVYGDGKTVEAIAAVFLTQSEQGQASLATRVAAEKATVLATQFPGLIANPIARTVRLEPRQSQPQLGKVAVLTAGTTDQPVAEEACETLAWMGVEVTRVNDVGVAGPHRLPARLSEFEAADALVVVAGMEGALPSVVGGYAACPVIAVPTSVGYGANFGGLSALLSMLNSCAANVAVVNIDAGFKAGYMAGLIARPPSSQPAVP